VRLNVNESGTPIATGGFAEPEEVSDPSTLLVFMSKLGIAMKAAGQSISAIQTSLAKIARAFQVEAQVAVLANILLAVLIGELKKLCAGNRAAESLVPVMSSQDVGIFVFSIVKADLVCGPLMLLIPPVVTFLPGALVVGCGSESHRPLRMTRAIAQVFVVPGSRISLHVSSLLLPAIWSAHYLNYLGQIAEISDQSDHNVRLT